MRKILIWASFWIGLAKRLLDAAEPSIVEYDSAKQRVDTIKMQEAAAQALLEANTDKEQETDKEEDKQKGGGF